MRRTMFIDLPRHRLASICCELGGVRSLGWLGGGDTLPDTRLQTIFGLLNKASELDGGVEGSACHVARHIKRNRHIREGGGEYCTLLHNKSMKACRTKTTYTITL